MLELGVFASGRGSNFQAILRAIEEGKLFAKVKVLISNNPEAGAIDLARAHQVPAEVISSANFTLREEFVNALASILESYQVNFIALAGYLKRVPPEIVSAYRNRILNIHPALLPSFGGKGMYGLRVHEAVLSYGCKVTGVTIHLVDEQYDAGPIVLQRCVPVMENDTPETLAERVLAVEHELYPMALQLFAENRIQVEGRKVRILSKGGSVESNSACID